MDNLYLIGNGFDLHHKIPSSYRDFAQWLKKHKHTVAYRLDEIYDVGGDWWSDFENNLGEVDIETYVASLKAEAYPDLGSDDYRDRDRYVMPDTADNELMALYVDVRDSFNQWVESLPLGVLEQRIKIETKDSFFITFNYTDTLNSLYSVLDSSICYMHGKANRGDELILGHGKTYDEIWDSYQQNTPMALTDPEEARKWHDANFDPIVDETIRSVSAQVAEQRKDTEEIIARNGTVFNRIATVSNIYIYGLSFSSIDIPYLDYVISKIDVAKTKWQISYFSDSDRTKIERYMSRKGIATDMYSLVKLDDLCLIRQGRLFV